MSTCPLCSRDAEVRNIQGTDSFGVRCALCGEFSASGEAVETARQQPALLRQLASIRRRRATENGERDEVTERWFEDPDGYGLRNEQVSVKLTRTLWLLADKSQRLGPELRYSRGVRSSKANDRKPGNTLICKPFLARTIRGLTKCDRPDFSGAPRCFEQGTWFMPTTPVTATKGGC